MIYCDTDSVKTEGPCPIEQLNRKLKQRAEKCKAYADDMHGVRHYIGVFEPDGHYKRFVTQGAKRYAFEKDNGRLGITVAGVSKAINEETGEFFAVEELQTRGKKKLGNYDALKRFKPGMIWRKAGGSQAVYNDEDDFDYQDQETGQTVHIGKNVSIISTTYEMTYSRDYKALLDKIQLYTQFKREHE